MAEWTWGVGAEASGDSDTYMRRNGVAPHGDSVVEDPLAFGIRGYACELFDDPSSAWHLHRERHLLEWRGDSGLRVDRFDARNLLQGEAAFRRRKASRAAQYVDVVRGDGSDRDAQPLSPEQLQLLDELRYADLQSAPTNTTAPPLEGATTTNESAQDASDDKSVFAPPWAVPEGLIVPATAQLHAILDKTARRTNGNPALEVMMRTRLADHSQFGFLDPTHELHEYYAFIRDSLPTVVKPIRLLGEDYAESEDEEESAESHQVDAEEYADKHAQKCEEIQVTTGIPACAPPLNLNGSSNNSRIHLDEDQNLNSRQLREHRTRARDKSYSCSRSHDRNHNRSRSRSPSYRRNSSALRDYYHDRSSRQTRTSSRDRSQRRRYRSRHPRHYASRSRSRSRSISNNNRSTRSRSRDRARSPGGSRNRGRSHDRRSSS